MEQWKKNQNMINELQKEKNKIMLNENLADPKTKERLDEIDSKIKEIKNDKGGHLILS